MAISNYSVGERDERPWGTWEVLAAGEGFIIKKIVVNPGAKLSLQSHQHRSEHWTVLSGAGYVTLNEQIVPVGTTETIFIPARTKHRMHNHNSEPLSFIEIQTGDILDEDDIERFDDQYGRA